MPNDDIRFSTLHEDGKETNVRLIKRDDIAKCPHYIFVQEHYRWDAKKKQWV